jgi:sterol desaturase/sphingolipid hydroxylase (fatty acid hydroxylase superfamily)
VNTPPPYRVHRWIDRCVLVGVVALGLLVSHTPWVWLTSFAGAFAALATSILALAWLVTRWAEARTPRIQGPRRKPPMIREEAIITLQAMWVMAGLIAWPITAARLGVATGFTWSLEGTGWSIPGAIAVNVAGVFAVDAWTYWKHRALHTKALFGFHRGHHTFRDPTAFASFAVGPFEALWTFLPVLIVLHPAALHWGPAYVTLVGGFVLLNMYLHCGVEVRWLEASVPRLLLNTSAFHNVHHSHVTANYGEVAYLWDRICRTRRDDVRAVTPAAEAA